MSLGKRIEERLRALGLSQAELARRAHVPQTTMNGLVRGNARTTPHLIRIAQELKTTPAFLMGEVHDPVSEYADISLSGDERELIVCYRKLHPKDKKLLLGTAHRLLT